MNLRKQKGYLVVLWMIAQYQNVEPADEAEALANEDCECESWERLSEDMPSEVVHCIRNDGCTGMSCAGKSPDGDIGRIGLRFEVYPCRVPIELEVHFNASKMGVNWTQSFHEPIFNLTERVPGFHFMDHTLQTRFALYVQLNMTREVSRHDVRLGVSLLGKYSAPSNGSASPTADQWFHIYDVIDHQALRMPKCLNGKPMPEKCRVENAQCRIDDFESCLSTEICRQMSSDSHNGTCRCRGELVRDEINFDCVDPSGLTPTDDPGVSTPGPMDEPSGSNAGVIVGSLFAVVVGVLLIAAFGWWWHRRRQTRLRIVRLYDDDEVLMRNDGYRPVATADPDDGNQIL